MNNSSASKSTLWWPKERRGAWLNLGLTLAALAGGSFLVNSGLAIGRAASDALLNFDSPDIQTLAASAFIGLGLVATIYGLRLNFFTLKLLADRLQGPVMVVGFVTTRETESWQRRFGRLQFSYRLYLVSRQAFSLWLHDPALSEYAPPLHWTGRIPSVVPRVFQVPIWAYEMVREGDLVQLRYARWQHTVLEFKVIESGLPLPAPGQNTLPKTPSPEIETAQWRVIEAETETPGNPLV